MLDALAGEERASLVASFDRLPDGARVAAFEELAADAPGEFADATEDQIAAFSATPEGAALVEEWGWRSPRKVALVRTRIARVLGRLDAGDAEQAGAWFDALPEASAAAIYRTLARG